MNQNYQLLPTFNINLHITNYIHPENDSNNR